MKPINDLPAICVSGVEWEFLIQRPQHIMRRYAERAPVFYIDPPTYPGRRILVGFVRSEVRPIMPNLWLYSTSRPVPLDATVPSLRRLNNFLVRKRVVSAASRLGIREYLLWSYSADPFGLENKHRAKLVVYDSVDDWGIFGQRYANVSELEEKLIARSDVVLTTAARLYSAKKRRNPHTYLVPNGVEFEHFSRASRPLRLPDELAKIPHPILGLVGAIYNWVDLELLEQVAKRRPDWSFVLVGPVGSGLRLPQLPNVHFLGKVAYNDLPAYLSACDVCLLLFRRSRLTDSVNPIKLYEYLATGNPIASTSLPEVRQFSELIEIGDGALAFEGAIERALGEDSTDLRSARKKVASRNSWAERVGTMVRIIRERRQEIGVQRGVPEPHGTLEE